MKQQKAYGRRYGIALTALLTVLLCTSACRKPEPLSMPQVRSDLLLDIFQTLDTRDYHAALPLIERYQTLDETNTFLGELVHLTRTNACLRDARKLAEAGNYTGARDLLDTYIAKYGELEGLVRARAQIAEICELHAHLKMLRTPELRAQTIVEHATALAAFAKKQKNKYPKFQTLADRKLAEAAELKKIEYDRACFGIYADARNALAEGGRRSMNEAATLTALLMAEDASNPAIRNLQDGGLYDRK